MDKLSFLLWISLLTLTVSTSVQGFSFDKRSITCDGKILTLLWDYDTKNIVTVIEWYKQPGVLIARVFGVNRNAPFTVLTPYNTARVKRFNYPKLNASIQITGVSVKDNGIYSVNVTESSSQSATLSFDYNRDCLKEAEEENHTGLIIGCCIAAAIGVVGVILIIYLYIKKKEKRKNSIRRST